MERRHEGFFEGHGGVQLFFQIWEAATKARGTILITHGQGEHSESYHRLVKAFENDGWNFWAWDMRGHGRSDGKRGYASTFEDYVLDYRIFLKKAFSDERVKKGPVFLLSHSMGGLVQLKTLMENPDLPVTAQVCSAPLLGLALPVPAWKEGASKLVNLLSPQLTMWNEIKNEYLTRDPEVVREFEEDVLRHNRISAGVFLGFEPGWNAVRGGASRIHTPTLFQLPENDPVVNTPAAREVFARLGSERKELKVYGDGACHEMYNDLHRASVYADLRTFLDSFV